MIVIALIIMGIIWVVFSYLSVRGIAHPDYAVFKKHGEYEIREYESYYAAEVLLKGTQKE